MAQSSCSELVVAFHSIKSGIWLCTKFYFWYSNRFVTHITHGVGNLARNEGYKKIIDQKGFHNNWSNKHILLFVCQNTIIPWLSIKLSLECKLISTCIENMTNNKKLKFFLNFSMIKAIPTYYIWIHVNLMDYRYGSRSYFYFYCFCIKNYYQHYYRFF